MSVNSSTHHVHLSWMPLLTCTIQYLSYFKKTITLEKMVYVIFLHYLLCIRSILP
jgi:hypothetical protein